MTLDQVILIALGIGLVLTIVLLTRRSDTTAKNRYVYNKRSSFLTSAEHTFIIALEQAVGDKFRILCKVRIADILTPEININHRQWQAAFSQISTKHFEYLLCDKQTFDVIAAIELDDNSHLHTRRQQRDTLVAQICQSADLPLLRFEMRHSYQRDDIRSLIYTTLPIKGSEKGNPAQKATSTFSLTPR